MQNTSINTVNTTRTGAEAYTASSKVLDSFYVSLRDSEEKIHEYLNSPCVSSVHLPTCTGILCNDGRGCAWNCPVDLQRRLNQLTYRREHPIKEANA